ncbi:hypothetical protein HAX54_053523 [Datura stramonium]|uniref:Uncharacterized protein n=1 Tax=Datura stramonium TaxID=4076 RepID=A0ABS8WTL0_DATST|nr:hypothetical protein [Datura stramonium]
MPLEASRCKSASIGEKHVKAVLSVWHLRLVDAILWQADEKHVQGSLFCVASMKNRCKYATTDAKACPK